VEKLLSRKHYVWRDTAIPTCSVRLSSDRQSSVFHTGDVVTLIFHREILDKSENVNRFLINIYIFYINFLLEKYLRPGNPVTVPSANEEADGHAHIPGAGFLIVVLNL